MKKIFIFLGLFFLLHTSSFARVNVTSVATSDGIGQIRIGMTLEQLNDLLSEKIVPTNPALRATENCEYYQPSELPGLGMVFIDNELRRIDISASRVKTTFGVRVGENEKSVTRKVSSGKRESLDHVPDGFTLAVEKAGNNNGILFQIYDGRLRNIIIGDKKVIRYAEGCM